MKDLLIKNGTVVAENSEGLNEAVKCDLLCSGGRIAKIAPRVKDADAEVIDASGLTVVPGGVDIHTHFNLDTGKDISSDDFYSGTAAAALGGTTTIVDHPGFGPAGCPLDYQINKYRALAESKAVIDYGFHGVIQHMDDKVIEQMKDLARQGISSFKIYLTYDFRLNDGEVYRLLKAAKENGIMIAVHPENHEVIRYLREKFLSEEKTLPHYHPLSRPAECEAEAINRMILIARMCADAPLYIVHLSNDLGLGFIKNARERGQKNLFVETCPQYLLLDDSLYENETDGLKYIMCPPLRKRSDNQSLWKGLEHDIDTVATDHCAFFFSPQKMKGKDDFTKCPAGIPGVEERFSLLFSEGVLKNRISLRRFTELCMTNPAKIFGIYPQKGVIREGSDADIAIIDPDKKVCLSKEILHANTDYSAYEGITLNAYTIYTISRGEVIARNGELRAPPGRGVFLRRGTSGWKTLV